MGQTQIFIPNDVPERTLRFFLHCISHKTPETIFLHAEKSLITFAIQKVNNRSLLALY